MRGIIRQRAGMMSSSMRRVIDAARGLKATSPNESERFLPDGQTRFFDERESGERAPRASFTTRFHECRSVDYREELRERASERDKRTLLNVSKSEFRDDYRRRH